MKPIRVNSTTELRFQLEEARGSLVVIHFYNPTATYDFEPFCCCFEDRAVFLAIDFVECRDIAKAHNVIVAPTFVFMKYSKIIDSVVGINEEELEHKVLQHEYC